MRRTIKPTNRQAEMVLAMFIGNEEDGHCTDDEIRELVTLAGSGNGGSAMLHSRQLGALTNPKPSSQSLQQLSGSGTRCAGAPKRAT
jgi:hypothetical protein